MVESYRRVSPAPLRSLRLGGAQIDGQIAPVAARQESFWRSRVDTSKLTSTLLAVVWVARLPPGVGVGRFHARRMLYGARAVSILSV